MSVEEHSICCIYTWTFNLIGETFLRKIKTKINDRLLYASSDCVMVLHEIREEKFWENLSYNFIMADSYITV